MYKCKGREGHNEPRTEMSEIELELRMYSDDESHELTDEELDAIYAELNTAPVEMLNDEMEMMPFDDDSLPF